VRSVGRPQLAPPLPIRRAEVDRHVRGDGRPEVRLGGPIAPVRPLRHLGDADAVRGKSMDDGVDDVRRRHDDDEGCIIRSLSTLPAAAAATAVARPLFDIATAVAGIAIFRSGDASPARTAYVAPGTRTSTCKTHHNGAARVLNEKRRIDIRYQPVVQSIIAQYHRVGLPETQN